jgi:hypothetical protein
MTQFTVTETHKQIPPGQSLALVYNFWDNWMFQVQLEGIEPPRKRVKKPQIGASHGKAPGQYTEWE